jgi:hypothetical protein
MIVMRIRNTQPSIYIQYVKTGVCGKAQWWGPTQWQVQARLRTLSKHGRESSKLVTVDAMRGLNAFSMKRLGH